LNLLIVGYPVTVGIGRVGIRSNDKFHHVGHAVAILIGVGRRVFGGKDSPVNGTSAPVFRLMSDS
jgi:hypothetical protein